MGQAVGFCLFDTPIGMCGLAWSEEALVGVQLPEASQQGTRERMHSRFPGAAASEPPAFAREAADRIRRLLEGEHDDLTDIALDMDGVPAFHQRVYAIARAIPRGRVLTYGEVARQLGQPGAARAVGRALGLNPFAPVVPCHRILASGHRAGGFSAEGGASTKLRLLEIEQAQFGEQPGLFDR